jgi:aspartyl-tRNA(Asn)/glutamyl-tRNA(Gln) amidotransferase subunit B
MYQGFEAVIGLEVHCQLSTESKIFCACRARIAEGTDTGELATNANVCPVCAGHPGALPVLNRKVVEYAVRAGLATGCEIRRDNVFARKNYFYADSPKGYQISQFEKPICEKGFLDLESKRVGITRIHMEEDAGKNVHMAGYSLVNLNRAGTPLVEIVSEPDMRTPEEAGAYLRALHAIVTSIGICDGNMQNGNFRCDANVSVRPVGQEKFGTRVEVKNVNSFRFVEKAIAFEIARQIEIVKAGGKVVQETRQFDAARNATSSMRSKEEAEDYRYFPDPDLVTVRVSEELILSVRESLPELPRQKMDRYVAELGLTPGDASVIVASTELARFFEATVSELERLGLDRKKVGKPAANLVSGEVIRLLNEEGVELAEAKVTPGHVAQAVRLSQAQEISSTGAKTLIAEAWKTGDSADAIVERAGLRQVSDLSALEPIVEQVLAEFPQQVADLKSGKDKIIGFLVGQIMKRSGEKGGSAVNPKTVQEIISRKVGKKISS